MRKANKQDVKKKRLVLLTSQRKTFNFGKEVHENGFLSCEWVTLDRSDSGDRGWILHRITYTIWLKRQQVEWGNVLGCY